MIMHPWMGRTFTAYEKERLRLPHVLEVTEPQDFPVELLDTEAGMRGHAQIQRYNLVKYSDDRREFFQYEKQAAGTAQTVWMVYLPQDDDEDQILGVFDNEEAATTTAGTGEGAAAVQANTILSAPIPSRILYVADHAGHKMVCRQWAPYEGYGHGDVQDGVYTVGFSLESHDHALAVALAAYAKKQAEK